MTNKHPKIIAHRGYSEVYKGNTIESFVEALKVGADYIEMDVRRSKDGELFCVHDPVVRFKPVDSISSEILSAKGYVKVADVLAALPKDAKILFDIKVKSKTVYDALSDLVTTYGFEGNTIFGVRSMKAARHFITAMPNSQVLGFFKDYNKYDDFFKAGGDIARVWENELGDAQVQAIKKGDLKRRIWVTAYKSKFVKVGRISKKRLESILRHDIDGVILNDPKLMKSVLEPKPPRSPRRFKLPKPF